MTSAFSEMPIREKLSFVAQLRETGMGNAKVADRCGFRNPQRVSHYIKVHQIQGLSAGNAVLRYIDEGYLKFDRVYEAVRAKTGKALENALQSLLQRAEKAKKSGEKARRGFNPDPDGRSWR